MATQTGITTSTAAVGHLKQVYGKYITTQQNLHPWLYKLLPKSPYKPVGQGYFFGVNLLGNESGGAVNETEGFRPVDNEGTAQAQLQAKINVWPIEFSGLADAVARQGQEEAFAANIAYQLDMALLRMMKDMNRQIYGDGTGTLGQVNGAISAATTGVVDFDTVASHAHLFRENMVVDIFDGVTKEVDSIRITGVDQNTSTLTFASAITAADNADIVKENIRDSQPSDGKELGGLRRIVDDGSNFTTYLGISRAAGTGFASWRSNIFNASSANITNDLLQRINDRIVVTGNEQPGMLLSNVGQRRKYLDITTPLKRFQDDELDSGYNVMMWNNLKWYIDTDCDTGVVYFLNKRFLQKYEIEPPHLADKDNAVFKWLPRSDAYFAYFVAYSNLASEKPNALARIERLAEPTF